MTRILLTLLAKNNKYMLLLSLIYIIAGIGIIKNFFIKSNLAETQLDWVNGKVWWNDLRIIHGFLYISFSITSMLNFKNNKSWIFLALDTLLGISAFLHYHYSQNHFSKLLNT